MGGSQSVEIPGGGTEGYHVLRVSEFIVIYMDIIFADTSSIFFFGSQFF
jgi:hypothetical protein